VALAAVLALGGARAAAEPHATAEEQSKVDDAQLTTRSSSRPIVRAAHRPRSVPSSARHLDVALPAVIELMSVAPRIEIVATAAAAVAIAPVDRTVGHARAPPRA
jgi:hypothetical protein